MREVQGLPSWADTERYDIVAKAPVGSTRAQSGTMLRNLLIERFKVAGHVEQQQRTTFAMVLARSDGRLGPNLKPASDDCKGPLDKASPEQQRKCGGMMRINSIDIGATTMSGLARSLGGLAGGFVNDRTGLDGLYSVTLHYSRPRMNGSPDAPSVPDDAPEIFTALQEQLGLKLISEKTMVPIFVIDHVEHPTED